MTRRCNDDTTIRLPALEVGAASLSAPMTSLEFKVGRASPGEVEEGGEEERGSQSVSRGALSAAPHLTSHRAPARAAATFILRTILPRVTHRREDWDLLDPLFFFSLPPY